MRALIYRRLRAILPVLSVIFSGSALAELDPELAALSGEKNNSSGLYLSASGSFGAATASGGGRSGAAYLGNADLGFVMSQGTWDRVEVSASVMTGQVSFNYGPESFDEQETQLGLGILAKFGQGYSLGNGMQAVWHVGLGPFWADHTASGNGTDFQSEDTISGLIAHGGVTAVVNAGSAFDVFGSFQLNHFQYDVQLDVNNDSANFEKLSLNVNVPMVQAGIRLKL